MIMNQTDTQLADEMATGIMEGLKVDKRTRNWQMKWQLGLWKG